MRSNLLRRVATVVVVAGVILAVLMFIAQDQQTLRIRSAVRADQPGHASYMTALVGAQLTSGNRFEVLTNGDQIFPSMLQAIDAARRRISFETYVYSEGEMAEQFTSAFERAARRGVSVNLVLDSVGSSSMIKEHLERLRAAGCQVAQFNEPHWYQIEEINYRTHRKILVVDGEVGFTGGVGVADHWIGHAQDPEHWRDTQIRMEGPIVRLLEGGFYENFIEVGNIVTPALDTVSTPMADGAAAEGDAYLVASSTTGGSNDLKRLYLLAIASAGRTLDITSPYFIPDQSSLWAIKEARARGVHVRVLAEGDHTDAMPVKRASRHWYERLLEMGVEIYEFQPTMMHTKVIVVDGTWSMFGSANFDNRSLELNDELNVVAMGQELATRFGSDLEQDLQRSRRITLEAWRDRPLYDKLRQRLWSFFGEVL